MAIVSGEKWTVKKVEGESVKRKGRERDKNLPVHNPETDRTAGTVLIAGLPSNSFLTKRYTKANQSRKVYVWIHKTNHLSLYTGNLWYSYS